MNGWIMRKTKQDQVCGTVVSRTLCIAFCIFFSYAVTGNKGNRWSAITVRMGMQLLLCIVTVYIVLLAALAVYTRSPAAYEDLKNFKLLQLPSVRTLKHYVGANHEDAGECMDRLENERRQYLAMVEEKRRSLEERRKARKNPTGNSYSHNYDTSHQFGM